MLDQGLFNREIAKQLHDLLEAAGVKVWFSEKDLGLGVPMMRAIDNGLAASKFNPGAANGNFLQPGRPTRPDDREAALLLMACIRFQTCWGARTRSSSAKIFSRNN